MGNMADPLLDNIVAPVTVIANTEAASSTAGSASTYATAAQGALATSALQPVVTGAKIGGGSFLKVAVVAGGAAGDHTLSAIKVGDELDAVLFAAGAGTSVTNITDLTSECTVGSGKINNTGHTDTSGGVLIVIYTKLTT
jgi:hypothetical protein